MRSLRLRSLTTGCGLLFLRLAALPLVAQHYPILPVPDSPKDEKALFQDRESRLWMGTKNGLAYFDGVRFYFLTKSGFPKLNVYSIAEDSDGGIWASTVIEPAPKDAPNSFRGGLYRFFQGKTETILPVGTEQVLKLSDGVMLALVRTDPGNEFNDLYRLHQKNGSWVAERLLAGQAGRVSLDHAGNLLFPCRNGWCEITVKQILAAPPESPAWAAGPAIVHHRTDTSEDALHTVIRDRFGCVWARAFSQGFVGCGANSLLTVISPAVMGPNYTFSLVEAPDGNVLTLGQLAYGRPGSFHLAQSSAPGDLSSALVAADGTIWLAGGGGLYRFMHPFRLEYWNLQDGVQSPNGFLSDNTRMYFAGLGVSVLEPDRRRWHTLPGTDTLGTVTRLLQGPAGTLYASAYGHRLSLLSAEGKILATSAGPGRGTALAKDDHGNLWLGGRGLFQAHRQGTTMVLQPQNFGDDIALDLKLDPAHKVFWACDWAKVLARSAGTWQQITASDGLVDDHCQTLAPLANGDVWVSYAGAAAFSRIRRSPQRLAGVSVKNYFEGGEVGRAHTAFLDADSRGWLWRGSAGLDYVATAEAAEAGDWLMLDQQDGLPEPGGNRNAFLGESDGSIWFGSGNTIVHFNPPGAFASKLPVPNVFVSGISIGKAQPIPAQTLNAVAYGENLTAHLGSLQFDRRSALRVRYRLLPDENAWQSSAEDGRALDLTLGRLRWGKHTLQVQARMGVGPNASEWSTLVEQTIAVDPPAWAGWRPLAGIFAFAGAGFAIAVRWRARLRHRSSKSLPALGEWRIETLTPELQSLDGTVLDRRFRVGALVARGGFASILRGIDLQDADRPCAVKVFRQELLDKEWMERRFTHEVAALERIDHPNVVKIYGHGRLRTGAFYLVMEFVEGQTLRERLNQQRFTRAAIARLLRQMGAALRAIHAHDICHRDLKPENVMLRIDRASTDELVLIDFSIAIVKDADETLFGLSRAAGTFHYMAPEQAIGYADCSSDIYSLAKILVEMLTGERLSLQLPQASMDLPDRVRELLVQGNTHLAFNSVDLIATALEFDPKRRPQDAFAFANSLADDLDSSE